jgi:hypothetical protein
MCEERLQGGRCLAVIFQETAMDSLSIRPLDVAAGIGPREG